MCPLEGIASLTGNIMYLIILEEKLEILLFSLCVIWYTEGERR